MRSFRIRGRKLATLATAALLAGALLLALPKRARAQPPAPPLAPPILLAEFLGHSARVNALAISPDGRLLASAGGHTELPDDLDIWLWDLPNARFLTRLRGHGSSINSLAFTPDGALLVSAAGARSSAVFGGDNTVRVWDADPRSPAFGAELARSESLTGWARGLAISEDGRWLAVARNATQTAHVWRLRREEEGVRLEQLPPFAGHRESLHAVAFSADARLLFSGGADSWLGVWEVATGEMLARARGFSVGPGQRVTALALHPAGEILATADRSGEVRLYDIRSAPAAIAEIIRLRGHRAGLTDLVFSEDGSTLFVASEAARVWLWDVRGGEYPYRAYAILEEHEDIVMALALRGELLATAGGRSSGRSPQGDTTVRLWQLMAGADAK